MSSQNIRAENFVMTEKHPTWLADHPIIEQERSVFLQLTEFFVFYSPLPRLSAQGKTLQFYGWKEKPWSTNRYLKDLL